MRQNNKRQQWSRRGWLEKTAISAGMAYPFSTARTAPLRSEQRRYWLQILLRIADPVLSALAQNRLKATMPVESRGRQSERPEYTHLEAIGRLLAGMAPWFESSGPDEAEEQLRKKYAEMARAGLRNATDPGAPDFLNFKQGQQPVVDAAFLALALMRSPKELWGKLEEQTQRNLLTALRSSRAILPGFNNWLLFSATIEAFFAKAAQPWDRMRVDYALRQHDEWYKGDGIYGDGPQFHWDYYNSFVIHPMLLAVSDAVGNEVPAWKALRSKLLERSVRYAAIQERLIAPDGSYPAIGRSLAYRCGAFHLLADMALRGQLPEHVSPAQVREALTAVIRRTLEAPQTFDGAAWLQIGLCGHQPGLGEPYISTGSLYLCSCAFLPLGLSARDPFWADAPAPWSAKKAWSGEEIAIDHAISG